MQIDTKTWKPVSEVFREIPIQISKVWFYNMISRGLIETIQPWKQPLLVNIESVKKALEDYEAGRSTP
jgi:hypothetical protein